MVNINAKEFLFHLRIALTLEKSSDENIMVNSINIIIFMIVNEAGQCCNAYEGAACTLAHHQGMLKTYLGFN